MQKHRIRLGKTDSVSSVNRDNKVDVDLQQTTKPYVFMSLKDEVDQYEVFKSERDNCQQYRLITTINPYCSNILFNPMTEIVKDEGSNAVKVISEEAHADIDVKLCYGKTNPYRIDMVRNTEYSRESIGYEYHPGMDIFNNHILRNTSFKIVNPIVNPNPSKKDTDTFNTIEDTLRYYNGKTISFKNRTSLTDTNPLPKTKHLYDYQDIMPITDSINNNLMEDNGWFGFVNKSSIKSKKKNGTNDENQRPKWVDEDFNLVINNKEACEFIDMYPDRTLYSFNPKYNFHKHRPEYNWHIFLTYPYENFYDHPLIKDKNEEKGYINALLINKVEYTIGINGESVLLFRTLTKHNLKSGDFINVYWKKDADKYTVFERLRVSDVGDLEKNNKEHFFRVSDLKILSEMGFSEEDIYENRKVNLSEYTFRFKHLINGYESEYYIRIFHKLPNLLKNTDKLTADTANNVEKLSEYINKNTVFDKEQYQLAFSSTIYNDNKTQLTFTDGINIENLLDNRGRPVSEIYLTILKNNKGNKEWYENGEYSDVEYSHCFSEVSCGFDLFFTDFMTNVKNGDVKTLNSSAHNGYGGKFGWEEWKYSEVSNLLDIKDTDNVFVGDLVEFNITNCNETVLEDCNFRFNTYMREHGDELKEKYIYSYDEITSDDYDRDGFVVTTYQTQYYLTHPEGYFYKAHYKIPLKEYGEINQSSHFDLKIRELSLDSFGDNVVLRIETTLPHRLRTNDILLLCDDERDRILKTTILSVEDENTFVISNVGSLTCQNLYDILKNKYVSENKSKNIQFKVRRYNDTVPFYAEKYPNSNRYAWRTLNTVGNQDNFVLPEYPFANGYLYINQDINFYLKRQDPYDEVGLYYDGNSGFIPNDIYGNKLPQTNYEYKEESEVTC